MTVIARGAVIAGKYRLERLLARGGMGSVWTAQDLALGAQVAVKFMDAAAAAHPEGRARFDAEARAAAQIHSPYVVDVRDHGVAHGTPYIVMELLRGEHLGARLERVRRLSPAAALPIVSQVGKALRCAHDAGIVHRDLKPPNIFLALSDEGETVKVVDFGIAKSPVEGGVGPGTVTGAIVGSPSYMSPEQAKDSKRVDHRSDLWSFGIILYRMLTGRLPFAGSEAIEILLKVCSEPIVKASRIVPELGVGVDAFFERALDRDPDKRFQSARDMARAFAALVKPAAGEGMPPPTPADLRPAPESSRTPPLHGRARPVTPVSSLRTKEAEQATASTDRGSAKVWLPAPGLVLILVQGHLCVQLGRWIVGAVDARQEKGPINEAFIDWEAMGSYDSDARVALSRWMLESGKLRAVHVLTGSKIVAMGVAAANLASGGKIASYDSRAVWQKALDGAIREALATWTGRQKTAR